MARATEESHLSEPYCYDSVSRFHDAVEIFLALAAQELHVAIPKEFVKYWDNLQGGLGRPLQYRAQGERLNKVRVAWKHFGVEPSTTEIEASRLFANGLIADECRALFGVDIESVSLSIFVYLADARELIDSAEEQWLGGDEAEAFADLADAFDHLVSDYKQRKMLTYRRSVYDFSGDFTFLSAFYQKIPRGKQQDFTDGVIDSLRNLAEATTMLSLGLDFRRYGKFKYLTPNLSRMANGARTTSEGVRKYPRTSDDFEFCRDFVISAAIRLGEYDYDFGTDMFEHGTYTQRRGRKRDWPVAATESDVAAEGSSRSDPRES